MTIHQSKKMTLSPLSFKYVGFSAPTAGLAYPAPILVDDDDSKKGLHFNLFSPLRPVNSDDFKAAMQKLKASVHDSGRELQKVVEWNDKYGEVKRKKKTKHTNISMYI
jgi:hypothetical protein